MAAKDNTTMTTDLQVKAREIDFVTQFARDLEAFRSVLNITNPIRKQPGTVLRSLTATVDLQDGAVGEGESIPYSKATIHSTAYKELTVQKFKKGVTLEAIDRNDYDVAIVETDKALRYEVIDRITDSFYKYLNTGTLTASESSWQRAIAMAKGHVLNKFKSMKRAATSVVAFANILDYYDYLGDTAISVQSAPGLQYIKDFMGYETVVLLSDAEIKRGRVIATAVNNIVMPYLDPSNSAFSRAGLQFTTDGETNLIGFHTEGNYDTLVSESTVIYGIEMFAEYIDAIAVVDAPAAAGGTEQTRVAAKATAAK